MYESRFGITGPPFQLSPDPSFYFDSRGHHRALAELRTVLEDDCGIVVVSGEVGAGKTMLVRTLLAEIDPAQLAVAHVVSTQLDADELLTAACIGFGLDVSDTPREELGAKLLRFLLKLDRERRRAVLIVDEAQNLSRDAFDKLLLATGKSARRMPLQVCLVGQPELRSLLETPEFAKLKSDVRASCHLSPIEPEETGAYIQHRLRRVGWSGTPRITPGAFAEAHRWSGGVPRRINMLCNRLMMACFLGSRDDIDEALVAETAREWRAEIGESGAEPPVASASAPGSTSAPGSASAPVPHAAAPARAPAGNGIDHAVRLRDPLMEPMEPGPLLCVVAGTSDHVKAAALMRAFAPHRHLPPVRLVRVHDNDALALNRALFPGVDLTHTLINLGIPPHAPASAPDELGSVFEFVVDQALPNAVIVFDGSAAALRCATVAQAKGIPVVHVGAGQRLPPAGDGIDVRKATDDAADLLYTSDPAASARLGEEGVAAERVHCVGNLLMDGMQMALRSRAATALGGGGESAPPTPFAPDRNGYALVSLLQPANLGDREVLGEILGILADVSRDVPLVWPVLPLAEAQMRRFRLEPGAGAQRLTRLPPQPYADYLELLRHATCVLTDSWSTQEEATALGVPCLTLGVHPARPVTLSTGSNVVIGTRRALATRAVWDCIFNGGRRGSVPDLWDGRTATRIAGYLAAWLPGVVQERCATV